MSTYGSATAAANQKVCMCSVAPTSSQGLALIGSYQMSRTSGMASYNPCSTTPCNNFFSAYASYSQQSAVEISALPANATWALSGYWTRQGTTCAVLSGAFASNPCFDQCTTQYYGYPTQDSFTFTPTASPAGCNCANLYGRGVTPLMARGVSESSTSVMNFWWQLSKNADTDVLMTMQYVSPDGSSTCTQTFQQSAAFAPSTLQQGLICGVAVVLVALLSLYIHNTRRR